MNLYDLALCIDNNDNRMTFVGHIVYMPSKNHVIVVLDLDLLCFVCDCASVALDELSYKLTFQFFLRQKKENSLARLNSSIDEFQKQIQNRDADIPVFTN